MTATVRRPRSASAAALDTPAARRAASTAASTAAFRASVEERLRALEAELSEVKSRLNGLLFLAAGTVLAQVVLHLFRW
ncbi:MAG: hypothetical protein ACYDCQ_15105 [Dehalococcoidia bacterium]